MEPPPSEACAKGTMPEATAAAAPPARTADAVAAEALELEVLRRRAREAEDGRRALEAASVHAEKRAAAAEAAEQRALEQAAAALRQRDAANARVRAAESDRDSAILAANDAREGGARRDAALAVADRVDLADHARSQVRRADRMLKARMLCTRIDQIGRAELTHVAQALHFRGIQQTELFAGQRDVPMDRITNDVFVLEHDGSGSQKRRNREKLLLPRSRAHRAPPQPVDRARCASAGADHRGAHP